MDTHRLRVRIRDQRRAVTSSQAITCAEQLALQACKHPCVIQSKHIAAYLAADGEIDPYPLLIWLWSLGKVIYLPVLVPFSRQKLWFAHYEPGDTLVTNRYGILEPVRRKLIKHCALDLVLTPLVAFDATGHRIGMGGGFYDRSFAFLNRRQHWHKPKLLGLAYEFQKQASIHANHWDVPLHGVVTETTIYPDSR